jgi:hypothetical protein
VNRRGAFIAAALIAVLALGVVGALALGGDDDEPRDVAADTATETTPEAEPEQTAPRTEPEDEDGGGSGAATEEDRAPPEPEPGREPAPGPAGYTLYSASTGDWQAELPSGNGWQQPAERQLGGGRRIRVTVRGPSAAALVIDHTLSQPARFGSKYRSSRELPQASVGSMTEYRLSDDAVGYILNAGDGGFRIFATGVDGPVARRVADSLTFVDL